MFYTNNFPPEGGACFPAKKGFWPNLSFVSLISVYVRITYRDLERKTKSGLPLNLEKTVARWVLGRFGNLQPHV